MTHSSSAVAVPTTTTTSCQGCGIAFSSRNAVFRHLKETGGACLTASEYADFCQYAIQTQKKKKAILLYGYIVAPPPPAAAAAAAPAAASDGAAAAATNDERVSTIRNGEDAARLLCEVLDDMHPSEYIGNDSKTPESNSSNSSSNNNNSKVNRSYGCVSRPLDIVAQDDCTGAVTEVMAVRLPELSTMSVKEWIDTVNCRLSQRLLLCNGNKHNGLLITPIRVFGRQPVPARFNAEMDVTHRRIEYLLPADFLFGNGNSNNNSNKINASWSRIDFFNSLPSFSESSCVNWETKEAEAEAAEAETSSPSLSSPPTTAKEDGARSTLADVIVEHRQPGPEAHRYLLSLKKTMQKLTTQIIELDSKDAGAVLEKDFHNKARQRSKYGGPLPKIGIGGSGSSSSSAAAAAAAEAQKNEINKAKPSAKKTNGAAAPSLSGSGDNDKHREGEEEEEEEEKQTNGDNSNGNKKRKERRNKKKKNKQQTTAMKTKKQCVLRRRRFHNFTPTVMAHEFLAYRRLDRLYHRATVRFEEITTVISNKDNNAAANAAANASVGAAAAASPPPVSVTFSKHQRNQESQRPFLALSLKGDLFLNGQAVRVIGLFVALARGVIDADFVDCVFDETYPHLVPTPAAPVTGQYSAEASYVSWEGKVKAVLSARECHNFDAGWNDATTLQQVRDWHIAVREHVAAAWLSEGVDDNGRLSAERLWTETVLEPWAVKARQQLQEYRQWKAASAAALTATATTAATGGTTTSLTTTTEEAANGARSAQAADTPADTVKAALLLLPPPLHTVDDTVPKLYEKVLYYLRQANSSGLWPSTTPKRQLVMVSTLQPQQEENGGGGIAEDDKDNNENDSDKKKDKKDSNPITDGYASSLSVAHMKAKSNKEIRSSAYAFAEGGAGGASGSFSVGAMPGNKCVQPKGNSLFPKLCQAAFELEMAICPAGRTPSSTIAVNRNAQFRPHTDSGAGAGQSTSLIVGLGTYTGGELVVEGDKKDIRYKAVEFNGWKQRHWTMPFCGERYSLVWFTPRGCEGIRGIDLFPPGS